MRPPIAVLLSLTLLAACGDKQEAATVSTPDNTTVASPPEAGADARVNQTIVGTHGVAVQAGRDAHVTVNYQKSQDY